MSKQSAFRPFIRYIAAVSIWAGSAHAQATPTEGSPEASAAVSGTSAAVSGSAAVAAPATNAEFDRGMAALQAGQNEDAIAAFNAAYAADGNPAALMNLGIAYTNAGLLNNAVESLMRYTQRADAVRDAETVALVKTEIERIRSSNGVVVVHATPANAAVQVDGQVLSPIDGELIVAPGEHRFVIFAEGFVNYDQKMSVAAGRFALDANLVAVSAAPVALPEPAVAATKPVPDADADAADEPEAHEGLNCVLQNVCFGPVLSLIGPPNLFGGGLHFRVGEYFGAGVDYQMTPSLTFDPISVSSSLFSINARVYPFKGAFFLGGGFGYQSITGKLSNSDVTVGANASFPAMMASIGFFGRDGFVMAWTSA
jgi:tetratricopeptide (TPR) repeat protein